MSVLGENISPNSLDCHPRGLKKKNFSKMVTKKFPKDSKCPEIPKNHVFRTTCLAKFQVPTAVVRGLKKILIPKW